MNPLLSTLLASITPLTLTSQSAEIVLAGDAMQHKAQVDAAYQTNGEYTYRECFEELDSLISAADFAIVNLETPLAGPPYRGYPNFSAPDSYAVALRDVGFDLFLTSNNHCLDCGDRGVHSTLDKLDEMEMPHVGTYHDPADRDSLVPYITTVNGFSLGVLNYTYGTNGIEARGKLVVDLINKNKIEQDINRMRQAGAEIICVAMHWGDEYILLPNKEERDLAQFLINQGVDIIFGGHPHVIQPMALIDNPMTGRKTALIYSLGNFISNMRTRDTRGGALAKIILSRDDKGVATVSSLAYKLIFTVPPQRGQKNYKVGDAYQIEAGAWDASRKAFVDKAEEIFEKHNQDVSPW